MEMKELIERVKRDHHFNPPLPELQIRALEEKLEYTLPEDLRAFYRLCDGATLFGDEFRIVSLAEVRRVTLDIFGEEDELTPHTKSWYSVCDVQDGNYVAADLASVEGSYCWLIDCFHESYSDGDVIALHFSEFLERALASRGRRFWLSENFKSYGRLYDSSKQ